jgi:hypothetical protein
MTFCRWGWPDSVLAQNSMSKANAAIARGSAFGYSWITTELCITPSSYTPQLQP